MGQKINPNIFRLGVSKTWKTAYYESNRKELPLYIFKDSNVLNFLNRYLKNFGMIVHDYNYHFSDSTIIVYISYFISSLHESNKADFTKKTDSTKLYIYKGQSKKKIDTQFNTPNNKLNFYSSSLLSSNLLDSKIKLYKSKHLLQRSLNSIPLYSLQFNNNFSNLFLLELCQIINLFLGYPSSKIFFCFNCLNKDLSYLKRFSQTQLKVLKRFNRLPLFKESIELLLFTVSHKKTSRLFSHYLSQQFQKVKRQNFFLKFIKQIFSVLLKAPFSRYKGLKIVVSGRLNGVPRAKHKIICIGDLPVSSISDSLDYSQTFCHNSNGSYGIKVWLVDKKN